MRATRVYFERTKSEPGYCNRKAGIEIEISGTERAADALRNAEIFVAHALNESPSPQQMAVALEFVNRGKEIAELPF
jgi:hypothetical protein